MTVKELRDILADAPDDSEVEIYYHYKNRTIIKAVEHVGTKVAEGFVFIQADELSKVQLGGLESDRKSIEGSIE